MVYFKHLSRYAPLTLRLGVSLVFLWFGSQQLMNPRDWTSYLPLFTSSWPFQTTTLVTFNGIFEIIFGTLLLIGFYTRLSSFLLALHLFMIILSVGYNEIGVRDFGLFMAALTIFFWGEDEWCLNRRRSEYREK